jgi:hypothetical protein
MGGQGDIVLVALCLIASVVSLAVLFGTHPRVPR